jgi:hypothetical protein
MTIETAYAALAVAVAAALAHDDVGFIGTPARLQVDPEAPIEAGGDPDAFETAASIETLQTGPVRQILGRPEPRWVVERLCRVELQAVGPERAERLSAIAAAAAALAVLPNSLPTLSGACERLILTGVEDSVFEPNGVGKILAFTLRVRSGDPLGTSA